MVNATLHTAEPMDLLAFARAEEARQARGTADVADEHLQVAGGIASFAGVGSWANQASGCGMAGPVAAEELDRLVDFYASRGVQPQVEVCPYADASLVSGLARLGFVTRDFENVLARELASPLPATPDAVAVRPLRVDDEAEVRAFFAVAAAGFGMPNPEAFERTERRMLAHPACRPVLAEVEGETAAVGNADVTPPVAGLFGMTTLARYRRRGCQRALMIARLRAAAEAGCTWAAVHSSPHVATGRNALRLGFQVAYTKSIMVLPRPGLAANP